jgi:hypothetical protein
LRQLSSAFTQVAQDAMRAVVFIRLCPTFYTHCTPLILGPLSTNSAMSKERYFIA